MPPGCDHPVHTRRRALASFAIPRHLLLVSLLTSAPLVSPVIARAGQNAATHADVSWDAGSIVDERMLLPAGPFPLFIRLHGVVSARAIGVRLRWFPRTVGGRCYELVDGPVPDSCGAFVSLAPNAAPGDSGYTGAIRFATPPTGEVCIAAWFDHQDCGGIEAARFYVAHLMLEDEFGERDYVPISNEAKILGGAGIEQPLALQATGRLWLIPGFVNGFHVSGVGFDSTTTISLHGEGGSIDAEVAPDSPRSLSVSFDLPEAFVGQALLVARNALGARDTFTAAITVYDSTAGTGSGVNGTDSPMDKPAPGGAWRKLPGDSTWAFVPAIPDSVLALGLDRAEAFARAHSAPPGVHPTRHLSVPPLARAARSPAAIRPARGSGSASVGDGYDRTVLYFTGFEEYTSLDSWSRPVALVGPRWGRVTRAYDCAKSFAGDWSVSPVGDPYGGQAHCYGYSGVGAANGVSELRRDASTTVAAYKSAELSFWRWIDTEDGQPPSTHTDLLAWYYSKDAGATWILANANGLAGHDRTWRREAISLETPGGAQANVRLKFLFAPTGGASFVAMPNDSGVFLDDVSIAGVPYPNLTFWRPNQPGNDWTGPIVVARHPNATSDEPVVMGQPAYFRFAFKNNSYSGASSTFRVTLTVEGLGDVYSQRLGPMLPWQEWMSPSILVSIPNNFCGDKRVTLHLDAEAEIFEQDESSQDNSFQRYVTWAQPSKPDLRVSQAWSSPAAPCAGDAVTLHAVVQNFGTAAAGSAVVRYAAAGSPGGPCANGAYVGSTAYLPPGATDTLSATVSSAVATTRSYDFGVDCTGMVDEGCPESENNNAFGPLRVTWAPPGADLAVTSFSTTNPTGIIGRPTQIRVTVANVGQVATPNIWSFDWYQDLAAPPQFGQRGIGTTIRSALAPGADTTVTLNKTSPVGTIWRMYVRANADTAVSECRRYANNLAGPVVLEWRSDSLLVRGQVAYRDTGYATGSGGAPSGPEHFLRGARVEILDFDANHAHDLLATTCTDEQGRFAVALAGRYDADEAGPIDEPRHVVDVFARVVLDADTTCAGFRAVVVDSFASEATWHFDSPVRFDALAAEVDLGLLKPTDYGTRSAMHLYETILGAAQRMRAYAYEPQAAGLWRVRVRWEPGGRSIDVNTNSSAYDVPHRTLWVVGLKFLNDVNPLTPDEWDDDVVLHEYGHHLGAIFGMISARPGCGAHVMGRPFECPPDVPNDSLAWDEGWATFMAAALHPEAVGDLIQDVGFGQGDAVFERFSLLETGRTLVTRNGVRVAEFAVNDSGPAYQESNAGFLWDLLDAQVDDQNQDGHGDSLSAELAALWAVVAARADSIRTVGDFWRRYHVASFLDDPRGGRLLADLLWEHGMIRNGEPRTLEVPGLGRSGRPALAAWPSPAVDRAVFLLAAGDASGAPSVRIYDVAGRRVRDLALKQATGSTWREEWDLRDEAGARVRPGVYFVRCWLGGTALLKTMVVMR